MAPEPGAQGRHERGPQQPLRAGTALRLFGQQATDHLAERFSHLRRRCDVRVVKESFGCFEISGCRSAMHRPRWGSPVNQTLSKHSHGEHVSVFITHDLCVRKFQVFGAANDIFCERVNISPRERRVERAELVQNTSQRPHVALGVVGLLRPHLRTHIHWRSYLRDRIIVFTLDNLPWVYDHLQ